MNMATGGAAPPLSLCVATRNRCATLMELLGQILLDPEMPIEVVVVDGASTDETELHCAALARKEPRFRYIREVTNSGLDRAYDTAVLTARGTYCWLFTDDDRLEADALPTVLEALKREPAAILVNASIHDATFSHLLNPSRLRLTADTLFAATDRNRLFADAAAYLSYIGAVIVRRDCWLARERERFIGSLFIHMGVLFQDPPLAAVLVLAKPLVRIRYGIGSWTAQTLPIWLERWPALVWSFEGVSAAARAQVCPRGITAWAMSLLKFRAYGRLSAEDSGLLDRINGRWPFRLVSRLVVSTPAAALNLLLVAAILVLRPRARQGLYDLSESIHAGTLARRLARRHLAKAVSP